MGVTSIAWDSQVDERIDYLVKNLTSEKVVTEDVPGLKSLLEDYLAQGTNFDRITFHRRLLGVFKASTTDGTYSSILGKYTKDEKRRIEEFVETGDWEKVGSGFKAGVSLGAREELQVLQKADVVAKVGPTGLRKVLHSHPEIQRVEEHGLIGKLVSWFKETFKGEVEFEGLEDIVVYENAVFQNWGVNVVNKPRLTCVPRSIREIQTIVLFAKAHNMSVRCAGFRHSWSPIFSQDGEILISLLQIHEATAIPNFTALSFLHESDPTELETIEMVPGATRVQGNSLVRIGAGATNERLRRWAVKNDIVTLPLNIIMVEITIGGSNAPICHGAGRRHATLSDLVRRIEYIDAHGKLQSVDNVDQLRAASGAFGLMGVVTHVTLEFEPMSYALLDPKKTAVIRAVPPPPDYDLSRIPPALLRYWDDQSPEEKAQWQADFERRANNDYYSEWFWFPYSDFAWINTWNTTADRDGVKDWPSGPRIFLSFAQTVTMNILQNTPLLSTIIEETGLAEAAVTLISRAAMMALPEDPVKTYVPDALHFQRSIQNVRVRDLEVEMPLVAKKATGGAEVIDYSPVQRAWWDAILAAYANTDRCPMRMPLEMRIMAGSEVIMAPQRGNNPLGTCAIEVLTLRNAEDIWIPFAQQVLDKWMALRDPHTGERLRTRPHWAKEWVDFTVDGKPWIERLKNVDYKDERREFLDVLAGIGKQAGWSLDDMRARFSNELFDQFFFTD